MKKIVVVAFAVVALAACAPSTTSSPAVTVTQTQSAPEPVQTMSLDEKVVDVARSQGNSYIANLSDSAILEITGQVCPILDSGVTVRQLVTELAKSLTNDGVTDPEQFKAVGTLLGVAVAAYCPQYQSQVDNL